MKMMMIVVGVIGVCGIASCAGTPTVCPHSDANAGSVENILKGLQEAAGKLRSYQCKVEYLFSQPVLESKTLRTGTLHYARFGEVSLLRISFDTLTQDEDPQQRYVECYIFDGQWLTHIDFQIKQIQKRQLAGPNEPIDAFELAKRNFPIIGFSKNDDLKNQFEVSSVGEPNELIHLNLKVKPGSQYADEYKSVDIWIDGPVVLPAKIVAVSTEGDIYEIRFVGPKVNAMIDEKVFDFTITDGFGKPEIIPLKK
jgi:outer membrane lipoprotein-sorting protein